MGRSHLLREVYRDFEGRRAARDTPQAVEIYTASDRYPYHAGAIILLHRENSNSF